MANLKVLKSRIKSVKSTQKMTKAMKMVAASRLRKAKMAVEASRPYSSAIEEIISHLASTVAVSGVIDQDFPLLTGKHKKKTYLLVVLSSDRGLCGGLNSSVVKYTKNRAAMLKEKHKEVKILCIGRKAFDQLSNSFKNEMMNEKIFGIFRSDIKYETAQEIAEKLVNYYAHDEFDVCEIIYNKFKSAIVQEPSYKQLIPAQISYSESRIVVGVQNVAIEYDPNKEEILSDILPKNLAIQIYASLLENSASEQGARMAAMEAATNNASKMIKNLTLVYNRTRQANITKELIDIISGANAV